jgi:hypothetical protein
MPHIVQWDEQIKYVRPNVGRQFSFMTPIAMEYFTESMSDEEMDAKVELVASELWFSEHMTDYISNLIKVQLEDVKEDP